MEKLKLDSLNKETARIGLGTWAIGGWMWGGTDEQESIETIHSAIDRGITMIDTAPVYGFGRSEEIVGKALKNYGDRDKLVVATKVGIEWDENEKIIRNSSRERIFKEIDDSLQRLQLEYIDIYQIHWPDTRVPVEETAVAMKSLLEKGKIKAIGVSNYSVEQMEAFRKAAPLHFCQPPYNLFEREAEEDIIPYCKENAIKTITYGTLCRGLLSGKMKPDTKFKGDDLRRDDPKFKLPRYREYLEAVDKVAQFAQSKYNKNIISLAVRWILDQGADITLWGARKPEQLDAIDEIWDWSLNQQDIIIINNLINTTVSNPVGPEFMALPKHRISFKKNK
jgi:aryl-alcohol dehydrogenase-like predicted oxidoreductase